MYIYISSKYLSGLETNSSKTSNGYIEGVTIEVENFRLFPI